MLKKQCKTLFLLSFILLISSGLMAQKAKLIGQVTDKNNGMELIGVNIKYTESQGTVTNLYGDYILELDAGDYEVSFSYVGYDPTKLQVKLAAGEEKTLNVQLNPMSQDLKQVVVTAGKFEQELSEITVSMEVLSPDVMENINPGNMEDVMNQVPGVTINKKQVNIRGGSGFSYGAGSRVMVLVDGLPMLTADAGDIKWNMLPMENMERIEVVKGASSALYGASALDGIINIITTPARLKPRTKFLMNTGFYDNPRRAELKHWDQAPVFGRMQLLHARKFKNNINLVASTDLYHDQGYQQEVVETRGKFFTKIEHQPSSIEGLKYGVSTTYSVDTGGVFFFWKDADSGAYMPPAGTVNNGIYKRLAVDPYLTYFNADKNTRHTIMNRYFRTDNQNLNNPTQDAISQLVYNEYQFQKAWEIIEDARISFTSGAVNTYSVITSALYGNHTGKSNAFYAQIDNKINKVNFSFGARIEGHTTDSLKREWNPVFRSGLNVQVGEATFLRSSIGQGFRYPSVAERYVQTQLSGTMIMPNPNLKSERGWSSEVGIKQGYQIGEMMGYFDIAAYISQYQEMIEFTFIPAFPPSFMATNAENSRVWGTEITATGRTKFNKLGLDYMIGYNLINPLNLNYDPAIDTILPYDDIFVVNNDTVVLRNPKYLKYRNKHTAKANVRLSYGKFNLGFQLRYRSFMENYDLYLMGVIVGAKEYRANNLYESSGIIEFDANLTYSITDKIQIGFFGKNLTNKEFSQFLGNMAAPRNFTFNIKAEF